MNVKYFIGGYDKNICYLIWCDESKHAAIIDPSVEINPILESFSKFLETVGEGTNWDLDYGKLVIIALLIYIAFFKTYGV